VLGAGLTGAATGGIDGAGWVAGMAGFALVVDAGDWGVGGGVGEGAEGGETADSSLRSERQFDGGVGAGCWVTEEGEADRSPPFAEDATGFGMTTVGGGAGLEGVCCGAVIGGAAD
jgi:hypothetical protein